MIRRELELRATKQTTWSRLKLPPDGPLHACFQPRSICSLDSVVDLPEDTLFDYCGIVVGCSCSAQGEEPDHSKGLFSVTALILQNPHKSSSSVLWSRPDTGQKC